LQEFSGKPVRAFVVWEPVLWTDWSSPSTATLKRISDIHGAQFWDKDRLISRLLGEHDRRSVVWDFIAVYPPGAVWQDRPPQPVYRGGPVVHVSEEARAALIRVLNGNPLPANLAGSPPE
jgi:hypothetical protein